MKVGTTGPEVFVPPQDGTILPEGYSFERPTRMAGGPEFWWEKKRPPGAVPIIPPLPGIGIGGGSRQVPLAPTGLPPESPGPYGRPPTPGERLGELPNGYTFEPVGRHVASINAVSERASGLGGRGPLDVLGEALPEGTLSNALGTQAGAASLAQWAQAYERVLRTGGGPQALGALNMMTKNLSNTLGVPIGLNDILGRGQNG